MKELEGLGAVILLKYVTVEEFPLIIWLANKEDITNHWAKMRRQVFQARQEEEGKRSWRRQRMWEEDRGRVVGRKMEEKHMAWKNSK